MFLFVEYIVEQKEWDRRFGLQLDVQIKIIDHLERTMYLWWLNALVFNLYIYIYIYICINSKAHRKFN